MRLWKGAIPKLSREAGETDDATLNREESYHELFFYLKNVATTSRSQQRNKSRPTLRQKLQGELARRT